jgi:hypothetical protein
VQIAKTKANGLDWDAGGGVEVEVADALVVRGARYLTSSPSPEAVLLRTLAATEPGRQVTSAMRSELRALAGSQVAPDPVLVVQVPGSEPIQTQMQRNTYYAGWDEPFFSIASTEVGVIQVALWDTDLIQHDLVASWNVSIETIIAQRGMVLTKGESIVVMEVVLP